MTAPKSTSRDVPGLIEDNNEGPEMPSVEDEIIKKAIEEHGLDPNSTKQQVMDAIMEKTRKILGMPEGSTHEQIMKKAQERINEIQRDKL
jgi:hypothetical protein